MISSNQDYRNAMKEMIRKVQSGYEPSFNASDEELELLSDCIKEGYIRGRTTYIDGNGHEQELRALLSQLLEGAFHHPDGVQPGHEHIREHGAGMFPQDGIQHQLSILRNAYHLKPAVDEQCLHLKSIDEYIKQKG